MDFTRTPFDFKDTTYMSKLQARQSTKHTNASQRPGRLPALLPVDLANLALVLSRTCHPSTRARQHSPPWRLHGSCPVAGALAHCHVSSHVNLQLRSSRVYHSGLLPTVGYSGGYWRAYWRIPWRILWRLLWPGSHRCDREQQQCALGITLRPVIRTGPN